MNLYSKLEKHLPREEDISKIIGCISYDELCRTEVIRRNGFNQCKAQYDEVLRRVSLSEAKLHEIYHKATGEQISLTIAKGLKAIANSPDVIKVEGE